MGIFSSQQQTQDPEILSYMTLRKSVGFLGIFLAPVLVLGTMIWDHNFVFLKSISAYYYTPMEPEMVGIICGISFFLISYDGYSRLDSTISKLSGVFALGIAFVPTSDSDVKSSPMSTAHYLIAAVFFVLLAFMSIFLFTKTSGNMTPQKIKRNRIYRLCGIIMLASVAIIPFDGLTWFKDHLGFLKPTLLCETLGLLAFGISWLAKGEFIFKDPPMVATP
jgi:hypothetical protein